MISRLSSGLGCPVPFEFLDTSQANFSTHIRYYSVDTELIDGNNFTKNHFDGFVAANEM